MTSLKRVGNIPVPVYFAASMVIALLLLWHQNALRDVMPVLREADASQIALGFTLYLVGLALLCVRWDALVRLVRGWSSLPRAADAFLTSVVINYAAPVSLAVPSRAALTKKTLGLTAIQTGAAAFWEVIVDIIVLASGSLIWVMIAGWRPDNVTETLRGRAVAAVVVLLLALASFSITLLVVSRKPALRERLQQTLRVSLAYPARDPARFAMVVAMTIVFWTVQGGVIWLLLQAVSDDNGAGGGLVLGLTTVPMLIGMLSPVPGGAGVREAVMVAIAGVYNANTAEIAVVAITYRLALFAAIPVLYLVVRIWRHWQPDQLPVVDTVPSSRPE